jgi:SAM-dependent methyltransferase
MQTLVSSHEAQSLNVRFYDTHAEQYCRDTVGLDMSEGRARFLAHLPPGGQILDAGCGSGRDSLAFLEAGYRVRAIDASVELVRQARARGVPAEVKTFQQVDEKEAFDGIWASASLLHVPRAELVSVLRRLARALRPGGIMYITLKYGEGEAVTADGRFFCYHTPETFEAVVRQAKLKLERYWNTDDRPSYPPLWMAFLVRRPIATAARL